MHSIQWQLAGYFGPLADTTGVRGPIGELVATLGSGDLRPAVFHEVADRHGTVFEPWFRAQVVDLYIGFVQHIVGQGTLTEQDHASIRWLRQFLRIEDGECVRLRPNELAALLTEQLELILEDWVVDSTEELQQVELQTVFGLSYDEYLALTRRCFERAMMELHQHAASTDVRVAADAQRKLQALEPLIILATQQRRSLGAMY